MLPCKDCAYREEIPGDCHISCAFTWFRADPALMLQIPTCQGSAHTRQWFHFPINYDPLWGPNECVAFATERDPALTQGPNPLLQIARMLGKRL